MRARGDVYHPIELLKDTPIGSFVYSGYDGNSYNVVSIIQCLTTENYSPTNHGSSIEFGTTMNNTIEPRINLKINHNGSIECL